MKKLTFLLIAITVTGLLMSSVHLGLAQTSTPVNGIINSDTTWTQANSPYSLTGNVLVNTGVTLTLQSGTTLNLNSNYIRVNGSMIIEPGAIINMATAQASIEVNGLLDAKGTGANPIYINGAIGYISSITSASYSLITFSKSSAGWNEQAGSGCIIENALINSTFISASNSVKLHNDMITGGEMTFSGGAPIISNNVIETAFSFDGASPTISNNKVIDGLISLGNNNVGSATITDNTISNAKTTALDSVAGIEFGYWGHILIQRNLITSSYAGIEIRTNIQNVQNSSIIEDNTIINNSIGVLVLNLGSPIITNNNIYNNSYNVKLTEQASNDIDMSNNWWGTTNQQAINQTIYDFKNDFNLGKVTFVPFLTTPNTQAMPNPNEPIPTPNPSSSVPEYPSVMVIAICLLTAALALAVSKRKAYSFQKK